MFAFSGYEGSYCEECLDCLEANELRRVAQRVQGERPYCDECLIKMETGHPLWLDRFLSLL